MISPKFHHKPFRYYNIPPQLMVPEINDHIKQSFFSGYIQFI